MITVMKFQSVIARHHARLPARRKSGAACLCLARQRLRQPDRQKSTPTSAASSPAVRVNGADIRMQVKPEGTAGGSLRAQRDGRFRRGGHV